MPQADLTSFHGLTVSLFFLVLTYFSFIYYYATPLWSAFIKSIVKKASIGFFLIKEIKNSVINFFKTSKVTYYRSNNI